MAPWRHDRGHYIYTGRHVKTNTLQKLSWLLLAIELCACTGGVPATPFPTQKSVCTESGSIGSDRVPNPTQGFDLGYQYYLPPCYQSRQEVSYPVLYLVTLTYEDKLSATDNTPLSLANRLIQSGKIPPVIVIVPDPIIGYGSDAALTKDLVPYVDGNFRTIRDRQHRGVGGLSHGAAIAVRMAFQFPETFGSVGLLSGGIADNEGTRFEEWIRRTPSDHWPRVHIDVGDQDGIMRLTQNLLRVLDDNHVPYTLSIGHGDHNWAFWSPLMEPYLVWFSQAWP